MKLTLSFAGHTCHASLSFLWSGTKTVITWDHGFAWHELQTWNHEADSKHPPQSGIFLLEFTWILCLCMMLWHRDNNLFSSCKWGKSFTFTCCGIKFWSGSENELIGAQRLSEHSLDGLARELSHWIKPEKATKKRDWLIRNWLILILKLEALQFLEIIIISR